ncbi:hypothetical protein MTO96_040732 [Rhipicephalus appendiculatus]
MDPAVLRLIRRYRNGFTVPRLTSARTRKAQLQTAPELCGYDEAAENVSGEHYAYVDVEIVRERAEELQDGVEEANESRNGGSMSAGSLTRMERRRTHWARFTCGEMALWTGREWPTVRTVRLMRRWRRERL